MTWLQIPLCNKNIFLPIMSHKKEGEGCLLFLTTISLPQRKRNQVESKKLGFSKPQFHSPKSKGTEIPSQNQSFPPHFHKGKLHFIGLARVN